MKNSCEQLILQSFTAIFFPIPTDLFENVMTQIGKVYCVSVWAQNAL